MASSIKQPAAPISVTIRNFFPPAIKSTDQKIEHGRQATKNTSYIKRSEYINIPPCRLDIIDKSDAVNDKVIYSKSASGAHPHWNHLNESIKQDMLDNVSTVARFTVDNKSIETPLHPSKLKPIAHSDIMTIPDSLPPNAILILYDDEYTRVAPSLYSLLVNRQIIDDIAEAETSDVFSESAFDILGDATDVEIFSHNKVKTDGVYDEKAFDLLGDGEPSIEVKRFNQDTVDTNDDQQDKQPASTNNQSNFETNPIKHAAVNCEEAALITNQINDSPPSNGLPDPPDLKVQDLVLQMQKEVAELRQQVQREQDLMQREEDLINQEAESLKLVIERVQQLENETTEIMNKANAERVDIFKASVRLETHSCHLLKQLRLIFPIKLVRLSADAHGAAANPSQHQFTVAGIPLPDDIHHPATSDDQVSTALGFTCHLMTLISKYLDIPMRYKIVCKFSRSVILDEGRVGIRSTVAAYPLFRERGVVDREQLDYGLVLLMRNVDTLLYRRQIEFRGGWNVLAKLDRLLSSLIDGKDF